MKFNSRNLKSYQLTSQAILNAADLETVTVKKIRNALLELYSIDLNPHKVSIAPLTTVFVPI